MMTRALEIVAKLFFVTYLGFFVYGFVRYPDAPIRPCYVNSYCGKQGQQRSREDYEQFQEWESVMPWAIGLFFVALIYLNKQSLVKAFDRK